MKYSLVRLTKTGLILGSSFIIACGRRTPPTPFNEVSTQLPIIRKSKINYRDQDIVLSWEIPKSFSGKKQRDEGSSSDSIQEYRVNVYIPSLVCSACEPELRGQLFVNPNTTQVRWVSSNPVEEKIAFLTGNHEKLFLIIVTKNFPHILKGQPVFFRIQYKTSRGLLSRSTFPLYPRRPSRIPIPEIQEVRSVTQLPIIPKSKINYRNQDIIISWEIPESFASNKERNEDSSSDSIQEFQVNVYAPSIFCSACEPELSGQFFVNPNTSKIRWVSLSFPVKEEIAFLTGNHEKLSLNISQIFFPFIFERQPVFFRIRYVTSRGRLSRSTSPLYLKPLFRDRLSRSTSPLYLKPPFRGRLSKSALSLYPKRLFMVPTPEIMEMRTVDGLLYIRWIQNEEIVQSITGRDGMLNRTIVYYEINPYKYYGINLYKIDRQGHEILMTPNPLYGGSASLSHNIESIVARSVDRFGNESMPEITEMRTVDSLLYIRWLQNEELIQSVIGKDGILSRTVVYYGLNLYKINQQGQEVLMTPNPLYGESTSLEQKVESIIARSVDRFGNESRPYQ